MYFLELIISYEELCGKEMRDMRQRSKSDGT